MGAHHGPTGGQAPSPILFILSILSIPGLFRASGIVNRLAAQPAMIQRKVNDDGIASKTRHVL